LKNVNTVFAAASAAGANLEGIPAEDMIYRRYCSLRRVACQNLFG
jgi:hypothetical protein